MDSESTIIQKDSFIDVQNTDHNTWHIHIEGLVQGVGFRPFVYRLAKEFEINGWVNNGSNGVHVEFNADNTLAREFYKTIIDQAPLLSIITQHSFHEAEEKDFHCFEITDSNVNNETNLLVTPDFAICENCKTELKTQGDRRYHYPFITCTHCGPRFSIIKQVPYDRENTTMKVFEMCQPCDEEYHDPLNRRHFFSNQFLSGLCC